MTVAATVQYTCTAVLLAAVSLGAGCSQVDPAEARVSTQAVVQGELGQRVDRFLTQRVDSGFNGAAVIAVDGSIILHKGYGWTDKDRTEPVTTTTPFWIASISKQFAAAAALSAAAGAFLPRSHCAGGIALRSASFQSTDPTLCLIEESVIRARRV